MRPRKVISCTQGPPVSRRRLGLESEAIHLSSEHFPGSHVKQIFSLPPWTNVFLCWLWLLNQPSAVSQNDSLSHQRALAAAACGGCCGLWTGEAERQGNGIWRHSSDWRRASKERTVVLDLKLTRKIHGSRFFVDVSILHSFMMLVERKPEPAVPKSFQTARLEFSVFVDVNAKGHWGWKHVLAPALSSLPGAKLACEKPEGRAHTHLLTTLASPPNKPATCA